MIARELTRHCCSRPFQSCSSDCCCSASNTQPASAKSRSLPASSTEERCVLAPAAGSLPEMAQACVAKLIALAELTCQGNKSERGCEDIAAHCLHHVQLCTYGVMCVLPVDRVTAGGQLLVYAVDLCLAGAYCCEHGRPYYTLCKQQAGQITWQVQSCSIGAKGLHAAVNLSWQSLQAQQITHTEADCEQYCITAASVATNQHLAVSLQTARLSQLLT